MKKHQLRILRRVLRSRESPETSAELDRKILLNARLQATRKRARPVSSRRRLESFFESFGAVSSTALAGVLTLAMIMVINKGLSPTEVDIPIVWTQSEPAMETVIASPSRPVKPGAPPLLETQSLQYDSDNLAALELPSVKTLMSTIPDSLPGQRVTTQLAISNALADINWLLRSGDFEDARDRYQQLRLECRSCPLPTSLEALASLQTSKPDNG